MTEKILDLMEALKASLVKVETAHSEHGASVAARWMACPGSINLSRGIVRGSGSNEYAQEGTAAHEVARRVLESGVDPLAFLDRLIEGVVVTEDMCDGVRVYTDYCKELKENATVCWVEHKFSLEALAPPVPMFGTSDFVAYDAVKKELEVVDLKFGRGVVVEVVGNKQGRYYALGSALELQGKFPIETVKITIVQPRAGHKDGAIRSDPISFADLIAFTGDLLEAVDETLKPNATLHAGSHCKFCPASGICPEQYANAQEVAMVVFDTPGPIDAPPVPETLPAEVFFEILPKLGVLETWIAAMRAHLVQLASRGEAPGYKLVEKRANRTWVNEEAIVKFLKENQHLDKEEIYTMKVKSPAQIEKVIGKKMLPDGFTQKISSGTNVVPIDDPRPAVAVTAGEVFTAITDGSE